MSPLHLDMGRYAAFVWPAYALTATVLTGMVLESLARARRWRRAAEREGGSPGDRP